MVRHFRCLQEKEARQTAQKAVQNGRRKKREEGRGRAQDQAATDQVDQVGQAARRRPHRESDHRRGKFGSKKGRIRAASLLGGGSRAGNHVGPTTSRGLNSGGWAARPVRGRAESGDKITERVDCKFRSWALGEGGKRRAL